MITKKNELALYGGYPVRKIPFPERYSYNIKEKNIVNKLLNHAILTGKPIRYSETYERQYEVSFTKFMGGGHCDLVNSGTNALLCSLAALNLPAGSEVLVPVMNDPGGVMPIILLGLIPVPLDIEANSYNTNLFEIKKRVNSNTSAVIVCHIGGEPANIIPIQKYLNKKNIKLIEDCSQSHGAGINNIKVGNFGDIAFFSTMASKLHFTGGQGGVIFSKNKLLIDKAKMFSDRGKKLINNNFTGEYSGIGINCNIDEISAAIGCVQIIKLPLIIKKTNTIGSYISKKLQDINSVSSIEIKKNFFNVFWFLRIKLDLKKIKVSKKIYCDALKAEGINLDYKYSYNPFIHKWINKNNFNVHFNKYYKKNSLNLKNNFINYNKSINSHYNIYIRENYSKNDIDDIVKSIIKIDSFFRK